MILAGVLLKLGGYGLLRVFPILVRFFNFGLVWVSVRLVGGFLVRLICMRQTELKSLIAYSSVAHIGLVIGGIMTLRYWGVVIGGACGSFALMVAHGLCSSGLFCLANISYERTGSRSLLISRGLLSFIPRMAFIRAAYTLYLFSYRQHGAYYSGVYSCSLGYSREFLLLFLHWLPLNLFVMKGDVVVLWL
ncbi:NADH-ubiquinone oxidoreductase chain 4 [Cryptotermes secundus]|uniref:NADH-ubiquinone oxidoreductase chain 4 n=1 Tax=Cryptotermes secundus TaxID=105785 RepID=A0A2J7PRJ3_9NEOP|nr:NADH-ubiquinone oxidoreductase chain 4 [Cryptotermes secundus]